MANMNTYKIPNFEYYNDEASYASPTETSEEATEMIRKAKSRNIKLGKAAIFGNL